MQLSNKTIEICGKERKFKNVPVKELKEVTKSLETLQKDLNSQLEEYNQLNEKSEELKIQAVNEADENKKISLKEESNKLKIQADEIYEKLEKNTDKIEADIDKEYTKICQLLLDPFNPKDLENQTRIDKILIPALPLLADLYLVNTPDHKIEAQIQRLVMSGVEQQFQQLPHTE